MPLVLINMWKTLVCFFLRVEPVVTYLAASPFVLVRYIFLGMSANLVSCDVCTGFKCLTASDAAYRPIKPALIKQGKWHVDSSDHGIDYTTFCRRLAMDVDSGRGSV